MHVRPNFSPLSITCRLSLSITTTCLSNSYFQRCTFPINYSMGAKAIKLLIISKIYIYLVVVIPSCYLFLLERCDGYLLCTVVSCDLWLVTMHFSSYTLSSDVCLFFYCWSSQATRVKQTIYDIVMVLLAYSTGLLLAQWFGCCFQTEFSTDWSPLTECFRLTHSHQKRVQLFLS